MTKQTRCAAAFIGAALMLAALPSAGAQNREKVHRDLSADQVENLLKKMNIKAVKSQPPKLKDDYNFDYEQNNYKIRLMLTDGKRLWASAFFPKSTLEKINQWNINAKFSRAVLNNVNDRDYAIIESQLDVAGGITDGMFRQFLNRFDKEVSAFDQFVRNN